MAVPLRTIVDDAPPDRGTRRILRHLRDSLEEATAALSTGYACNGEQAAFLADIDRLALLGMRFSNDGGCVCWRRFQAIHQDTRGLRDACVREDTAVYDSGAWLWVKRALFYVAQLMTRRSR